MSQDHLSRRQAVTLIIGGVAVTLMLPNRWTKPLVESVVVPAHACASPCPVTTTSTSPGTSPATTTTAPPSTTTSTTTTTTTTTTTFVTRSDIRVKRDFARVGQLANGLPLYRFRYLWSDVVFVGVMAQDVLKVMPEAVSRDKNGFMQVDYARLGTRMMTWDEWERERLREAVA